MTDLQIDTILAQIGNQQDELTGAVSLPVHFSTTFAHPTLGESTGFDYTRTQNPTRLVLETALAELEGGVAGFATSSGMSAIQLVLSLFPKGSQLLASRDLYGGSYRYFNQLAEQGFYEFSYFEDIHQLQALISDQTAGVFVETPTNPLMSEIDILAVATVAKNHQALVIVDNTFYTPIIQKPLELGADIVVHSATKYLGGHNDVLAGAVITNDRELGEQLGFLLNTTGAVLSPFDCWLLIRGLKTLAMRMERHEANAQVLVGYLETEKQVTEVIYPGRGGMISIKLQQTACIKPFLGQLRLFTFAESLGGVESLITYPTTQTHGDIPKEVRESYGLSDNLLRISVGVEGVKDLIDDLKQAFDQL